MAPNATIIAVKVADGTGSGYLSWVIEGIVYAATEADADVINISLCGHFPKSGVHNEWLPARDTAYYLRLMERVTNFAAQQDVTVASAAGNEAMNLNHNRDWVVLPAEAENGIAVSATGPVDQADFDNPASYTNYGASVIDVAAPGGDHQLYPQGDWWLDMVMSTLPGGWGWADGTSMAAPHVSGVAALIIEQNGGEMKPSRVKAIIEQSADDLGKHGMDDYYGRGRINAYMAVSGIKKAPAIGDGRITPARKLAFTWAAAKTSQ